MICLLYFVAIWEEESAAAEIVLDGVVSGRMVDDRAVGQLQAGVV
jgi:hypothetical protein